MKSDASGMGNPSRVTVIAFDLGDTLVEYEGLPLSWEDHYPAALAKLGSFLGVTPNKAQIDKGCSVLRRYNTRLYGRTQEVSFATILAELLPCLGYPGKGDELLCAMAFFAVFRQRLRCFSDTRAALERLRGCGHKIGVFTDVPYGMPRELVLRDVAEAGLADAIDVLLTSRDTGCRKPSPGTLRFLAAALGCGAGDMSYVGNEKKDVEAAKAFGCRAVLIDRAGRGDDWGQHETIRSLAEL